MSTPPVLSVVGRLPQAITNKEAIAILEQHLELARSGKIVAVGVASVLDDGRAQTSCSATSSATMLLGAIGRLWHQYNVECITQGPPAA